MAFISIHEPIVSIPAVNLAVPTKCRGGDRAAGVRFSLEPEITASQK